MDTRLRENISNLLLKSVYAENLIKIASELSFFTTNLVRELFCSQSREKITNLVVLKCSFLKQSLAPLHEITWKANLIITKSCKAHITHWLRYLLRLVAAIKIHADCAETADYAGIGEWAKLDLQSIQHRDYFGHLSICLKKIYCKVKNS